MSRRRASRSKKGGQFVWSAARDNGTIATIATQRSVLVTGTDWAVNASERGTLMSIRGFIQPSAVPLIAATTLNMFILRVDKDLSVATSSVNPLTIQNYVDEDVLWAGVWRSPGSSTGSIEARSTHVFEINVKAMRKMRADDDITLFWSATTDTGIVMTLVLRSLTKVNT